MPAFRRRSLPPVFPRGVGTATRRLGFGGRCFNIRDVCMDFEPCFKVYNLVSIRPKSMKLGQMTNLNIIFHMVGSVYRLVTIQNSPQFPVEFRNGLFARRDEQVDDSTT